MWLFGDRRVRRMPSSTSSDGVIRSDMVAPIFLSSVSNQAVEKVLAGMKRGTDWSLRESGVVPRGDSRFGAKMQC